MDSSADADGRGYELTLLRWLSRQFPNVDAAMAEIARLSAVLTLPKGTVHVISDIHGEDKKLRHVINNASGTLRPVVERLFAGRMEEWELKEFLTLTFYPAEVTDRLQATMTEPVDLRPSPSVRCGISSSWCGCLRHATASNGRRKSFRPSTTSCSAR